METVINDRTAITDVCGQKFLTKRTWPGSGKFGLEALEREQKNHVVVHHALQCMENDVLQVPEPVTSAANPNEFWQEYVDPSTTIWSVFSTPGSDEKLICHKSVQAINALHAIKISEESSLVSNPEMPSAACLSYEEYRSLPVWGRAFVGKYATLLQKLKREWRDSIQHTGRATYIHGDLTVDNILSAPNGGMYFIDWERAGVGQPEHDLAAFYSSILVATAWKLNSKYSNESDSSDLLEGWINSWQRLVVDSIFKYRGAKPNPNIMRILLSSKLACRAYSKATVSGPEDTFVSAIMKIADSLYAKPRVFTILYRAGVLQ